MIVRCLLALACLGLLAPSARPLPDDSALVAEFRRYYDDDRPVRERLLAVRTLEGLDSLAAAEALLPAFEDEDAAVREAAVEVVGAMEDPAVAQYLTEEVLLERRMARRERLQRGVMRTLGRMRHAAALEPLLERLDERDEAMRRAAIDALGSLGDPRAAPALTRIAVETDVPAAISALRALVAIGDVDAALEAVLAATRHDDWQVRATAIEAIVTLRPKPGIDALIERLRVEEGRLRGDAYQALRDLTFTQFADDPDLWQRWWDRNRDRFELPDPEAVAQARARRLEEGTRYTAGVAQAFLGVETTSENILFVIDVSSSMEDPFGDKSRLLESGRRYDSLQRLAIVKEELVATIEELPDTTSFNVLSFARDVDAWKKRSVRANVLNKNNAIRWVERLQPVGGAASSFRARSGLGSDAEQGSTNTHLAIMTALGVPVEDQRMPYTPDSRNPIDTVFFLTDGEPTSGVMTDMNEIVDEVRRENAFRNVQIHVIYVGAFGGQEFERLAHENNGVFVAVGG